MTGTCVAAPSGGVFEARVHDPYWLVGLPLFTEHRLAELRLIGPGGAVVARHQLGDLPGLRAVERDGWTYYGPRD
ncbi:MAG TPA: hypothetical protein VGW75_15730 [Solirubrobacteraceae bacterium]|nr:hypothetical protein [Solirubrobacteraceae bacterium]